MIGNYPTSLMRHTSTHYACPTTLLPGTVGLVAIPSTRQHSPSMASQMTSAGMSCPHSPTTAQWTSAAGKSHATQATDTNYHVRHQLVKQHGQPHHALPGPQHPDHMRGQTTTPSIQHQQLHCWMQPITRCAMQTPHHATIN